jgi:hypothetical protein
MNFAARFQMPTSGSEVSTSIVSNVQLEVLTHLTVYLSFSSQYSPHHDLTGLAGSGGSLILVCWVPP